MKRLRRPSLSDSRPKNSAPTTSPARYTLAISPTAAEDRPRVSGWVRVAATALATGISRPSRLHATPSPTTILVWNGEQGTRARSGRGGRRSAVAVVVAPPPPRRRAKRLRRGEVLRGLVWAPHRPRHPLGVPGAARSRCG